MGMKGAELMVSILEQYGVTRIFGLPGDATPFFRALEKSSISFITMRDERHVGFATGVYGYLSDQPAVAYVSRGPGGTNLLSGIACAFLESYPAIYIVDQQNRKDCIDRRVHMFVDFGAVYEPVSKGVDVIWKAEDIPQALTRAWLDVQTPPKGPRCLVVPQDIFDEDAKGIYIEQLAVEKRKDASFEAARRIKELLEKSRQPVLILGPDIRRYAQSGLLNRVVNHLSLPFFTTRHAKGVIAETHPLNYGIMRKGNLSILSSEFDLVVTIGHGVPDKNYLWAEDRHKITHINITDNPCVRTDWFNPSEEYIVNWDNFFDRVLAIISKNDNPKYFSMPALDWQERERRQLGEKSGKHLLWHFLSKDHLGSILGPEDIIIPDTGLNKIYVLSAYQAPGPNILCASAFSAIGFAIPASIGASLAKPNARVVVVCGDGGFLMSVAELETIRRLNLPVKIIMVSDGAYGYIKERQHEAFGGCVGVDFTNPNFRYVAKAFDFRYVPVRKVEDLKNAEDAILSPGSSLIVLYQKYRYK